MLLLVRMFVRFVYASLCGVVWCVLCILWLCVAYYACVCVVYCVASLLCLSVLFNICGLCVVCARTCVMLYGV